MSFDTSTGPQRIAVVGAGISGRAAGYHLAGQHRVTVFESADRSGGHARTVVAGKRRDQPVDTGFIVFNYANYPGLTGMFDALGVPLDKCDMSFAASIDDGQVEYGLSLASLAGQKRNLFSLLFYGMIGDILRFISRASRREVAEDVTLAQYLEELRTGRWFRDSYLTPLCGAIWSTPPRRMLEYPAAALTRFFKNHHLLGTWGQHQ